MLGVWPVQEEMELTGDKLLAGAALAGERMVETEAWAIFSSCAFTWPYGVRIADEGSARTAASSPCGVVDLLPQTLPLNDVRRTIFTSSMLNGFVR